MATSTVAAASGAQRQLSPARHWHATGYTISVSGSLLMAVAIGVFFIGMKGWSPPVDQQLLADFSVTFGLLTYIWLQMGSLILVGSGTKNQMWLDALTSIIPLFMVVYVLLQHHTGIWVLSYYQAMAAWACAYTMLLDVVIDLGVSVLLSRQVVDVGGGGVG